MTSTTSLACAALAAVAGVALAGGPSTPPQAAVSAEAAHCLADAPVRAAPAEPAGTAPAECRG